jgi:hypothetical protein
MAVKIQNHVTKEEVESSYEFKLMKKILKKEFPWIKDVVAPSDDQINEYGLIFLDIVIDPFMLQRETGWPLASYIKMYMSIPGFNTALHSPYIYSSAYLTTIYDVSRDESKDISNDVENTVRSVASSPAVPQDLKLGKDRSFAVGAFTIPQGTTIPEDAIFTSQT